MRGEVRVADRPTAKRHSGSTPAAVSLNVTALLVIACLLTSCSCSAQRVNSGATPGSIATDTAPAALAPEPAGTVLPPTTGAYLGLYRPPAPFREYPLETYSAVTDKPPAILMWYQPWAEDGPSEFDGAMAVRLWDAGMVPMISWEPWNPGNNANYVREPANQSRYKLANIIRGDFDPYLIEFARSVRDARGPVMIRLMHEMNGDWYPWCGTVNGNKPGEFVAAWRHVHDIFEAQGATNVTWVWSVNHESVPDASTNAYKVYYPGDEYVDWVAMSGFNWGTSSPYSSWRSFEHWYTKPMGYLKTVGKPVMIAEFSAVENGGDKAAWITDAYAKIRTKFPFVRAVVFYDSLEKGPEYTQDWRIESSKASAAAYREAISIDYFRAGPATTLDEWAAALTPGNYLYLRSTEAVY